MYKLFFRSLTVVMALLCLAGTFRAANINPLSIASCGTIILNDDVILVTTTDPADSINLIRLKKKQGETYVFQGCGLNKCSTDISSVPDGTYTAYVHIGTCVYEQTIIKH